MKTALKILAALMLMFHLQACDDGEVIVTSFDFSDTELQLCGGSGDYVFFIINEETRESLSLKLSTPDSILKTAETLVYTLDGTNNYVNYRRFDGAIGADYFCSSVPPLSPKVIEEYFGASGTVTIEKTFHFYDSDNVPDELEFDGDTDGDGIPDLYDFDDDGDNVPTALELDLLNTDGDGDPFTNPKDTDGDELPDYLDPDDDGDGVLSRNEDRNLNLDPTDDITDPAVGADYLNGALWPDPPIFILEYREHPYFITKDISVRLSNVILENGSESITQESLHMGEKLNVEIEELNVVPVF